jgi:hypothetical protein
VVAWLLIKAGWSKWRASHQPGLAEPDPAAIEATHD